MQKPNLDDKKSRNNRIFAEKPQTQDAVRQKKNISNHERHL